MIAVERRGALGNQLFQFAFGIATSARFGTSFVMADDTLRQLFTLGPYAGRLGRGRRALSYRLARRVRPYPVVRVSNTDFTSPRDVFDAFADRRHYEGFFQSEEFFASEAHRVREAYTPLPRHRKLFESCYGRLAHDRYICCHVRRGDYLQFLGGVALPVSYYAAALASLDSKDIPVVFVGDDLSEVRKVFAEHPNVSFEHNDEIVDLQLLAHAESVVASNSTFAWWGAWLGRPDRTVVAPRHWLGFKEGREYPPAIIPPRWRQIAVEAG